MDPGSDELQLAGRVTDVIYGHDEDGISLGMRNACRRTQALSIALTILQILLEAISKPTVAR